LAQLREYYQAYKPKKYLFEEQYGDQYSIAQQVFKNSLKKAKINKKMAYTPCATALLPTY
jgi:integrase/recombinase XerD